MDPTSERLRQLMIDIALGPRLDAPSFANCPDPAYYVRPPLSALVELARHGSIEDAAVAHAVSLEPPEVDFINRAVGDW